MDDAEAIARLLNARRIAVVGLSDNPSRAAWMIARYMLEHGIDCIPVNPRFQDLMGKACYASVRDIPERVDLVDVFRRAEFCPAVVEDALAARAGGVWLQSGIVSLEARSLAAEAGMDFVENRCFMVEHMRR